MFNLNRCTIITDRLRIPFFGIAGYVCECGMCDRFSVRDLAPLNAEVAGGATSGRHSIASIVVHFVA